MAGKSSQPSTTIDGEVELKPIGSLSPECTPLKIKYDECFNRWFSERFLKGDNDLSVCDELFRAYNTCVKAAIIRMGIDTADTNRGLHIDDKEQERLKKEHQNKNKK